MELTKQERIQEIENNLCLYDDIEKEYGKLNDEKKARRKELLQELFELKEDISAEVKDIDNKMYVKFINDTLVQTARLIQLMTGKFAFETSLFGTKPYEININIPFFDKEKDAYNWIEKQDKWTLQ